MQIADATAAGDRLVEHRATGHLFDVLPKVADGQLLRHRHLPIVWPFFADDHAKEGGFPRTVRPHEAHAFAWVQLEGGVDEEDLLAVLLVDAIEADHARKA